MPALLRLFGVHGPKADPARLTAMISAMDRALDPGVYSAVRDLAPHPSLQIRLRSSDPARLAASVATDGAVTVAGKVRLYDEAGPPETDLARLAAMLARDPAGYPHRTGEFGVVSYDAERRAFSLAVDALGSAPIYYARLGEILAFANWPHLLLALPDLPRDLDPVAVAAYLGMAPQPQVRTFFSSVRRLAPAQSLTRGADGAETFAIHWRAGPASRTAALDDVAEATTTAIRARLRHTVRPAIELSGGLDSSLVAGLATRLRPDLRFQSLSNVLPPDYRGADTDERPYIEAVLADNPSIAPGYVTSSGADVFSGADDAWDRLAAPCLDAYRFMTSRALELAGDADALIGGFGGDQCLSAWGGPYLFEMLSRGRLVAAYREWSRIRRVYGSRRVPLFYNLVFTRLPIYPIWKSLRRPAPVFDALTGVADPEAIAHLRRWGYRRHTVAVTSMRRRETENVAGVDDWLVYDHDDPGAGRSLPNLQPLIDPRVIEAVMAAPSDLKVAGERDRALIRAIGADCLPPLVADRLDKKPFSPDYVTLVAARAPDIARAFARFRANPLWRENVDADVAEATLARFAAAPAEADIDAVLGQIVRSYYFGLFLERAFD